MPTMVFRQLRIPQVAFPQFGAPELGVVEVTITSRRWILMAGESQIGSIGGTIGDFFSGDSVGDQQGLNFFFEKRKVIALNLFFR